MKLVSLFGCEFRTGRPEIALQLRPHEREGPVMGVDVAHRLPHQQPDDVIEKNYPRHDAAAEDVNDHDWEGPTWLAEV